MSKWVCTTKDCCNYGEDRFGGRCLGCFTDNPPRKPTRMVRVGWIVENAHNWVQSTRFSDRERAEEIANICQGTVVPVYAKVSDVKGKKR